jgi:hypothetical protein
MNVIELMVLNKLNDYREKANRDRFIGKTKFFQSSLIKNL